MLPKARVDFRLAVTGCQKYANLVQPGLTELCFLIRASLSGKPERILMLSQFILRTQNTNCITS